MAEPKNCLNCEEFKVVVEKPNCRGVGRTATPPAAFTCLRGIQLPRGCHLMGLYIWTRRAETCANYLHEKAK